MASALVPLRVRLAERLRRVAAALDGVGSGRAEPEQQAAGRDSG